MKSEFKEVAYKLSYDVEHYEKCGLDWQEDILIEKIDSYVSYKYYDAKPIIHPNPVIFTGYPDVVKHIDYPEPDNNWNVMSKRMYDTLLSIGNFPHHVIPVAIVDWRVQKKDWYNTSGNLRKEIALWNFVAIQLTEHLDIFDYEKSKYTMREDKPDEISMIDEFVFKIPETGLPPIFKITTESFYTFVSAEARQAMKDAKTMGTRYQLLTALGTSFVDTPIVLPDEVYQ